jgi:hypothetical protein
MLKTGAIVDATIIAAPSATKNKEGERDPEMHQTKKGNGRVNNQVQHPTGKIPRWKSTTNTSLPRSERQS